MLLPRMCSVLKEPSYSLIHVLYLNENSSGKFLGKGKIMNRSTGSRCSISGRLGLCTWLYQDRGPRVGGAPLSGPQGAGLYQKPRLSARDREKKKKEGIRRGRTRDEGRVWLRGKLDPRGAMKKESR